MTEITRIGNSIEMANFPESHYFREVNEFFQYNIDLDTFGPFALVHGVPFHFNPIYKIISVNFSAGADSTMLTYILCRIIEQLGCNTQIHPTSIVRYFDTAEFSEQAKERVYNWFKQRFPNIIGNHIWGFIPPTMEFTPLKNMTLPEKEREEFRDQLETAKADVLYFHQFNQWATRKYKLEAIYNGTTTNPVDYNVPNVPGFRNRIPLLEKYMVFSTYNVCPFTYLEKNWVTAQYTNFGVEDLFEITQSCESQAGGCNSEDCFHCVERQWSIDNKNIYLIG